MLCHHDETVVLQKGRGASLRLARLRSHRQAPGMHCSSWGAAQRLHELRGFCCIGARRCHQQGNTVGLPDWCRTAYKIRS